ncbi:MAG: HAD family hydrolase [Acidimicrobiales bacterium]
MAVDAVIFDWGGTLSAHADVDLADMWRLAARHLDPEREHELTAALARVEAEGWDRVMVDQRAFTLSQILQQASEATGLDVTEAVLEEAATHHLDTWTPHIRHDPEAVPVIAALRDAGLRIALLSNTHWPRPFHEHFLERDGLVDLIDARLYTSEMQSTKPHPSSFKAALSAVGVSDPTRAVMVGDRLFDDIFGAKALGMRTVYRPNRSVPGFDVKPDATIRSLVELIGLIDTWMAE